MDTDVYRYNWYSTFKSRNLCLAEMRVEFWEHSVMVLKIVCSEESQEAVKKLPSIFVEALWVKVSNLLQ